MKLVEQGVSITFREPLSSLIHHTDTARREERVCLCAVQCHTNTYTCARKYVRTEQYTDKVEKKKSKHNERHGVLCLLFAAYTRSGWVSERQRERESIHIQICIHVIHACRLLACECLRASQFSVRSFYRLFFFSALLSFLSLGATSSSLFQHDLLSIFEKVIIFFSSNFLSFGRMKAIFPLKKVAMLDLFA